MTPADRLRQILERRRAALAAAPPVSPSPTPDDRTSRLRDRLDNALGNAQVAANMETARHVPADAIAATTVRPDVLPPPSGGPIAPANDLPPTLAAQPTPDEQRRAAAVEQLYTGPMAKARALIPGAAPASFVERAVGRALARLPEGPISEFGERTAALGEFHGEQEARARETLPFGTTLPADIGNLYLELEAGGRIPGPIGRAIGAGSAEVTPGMRALFDESGRIVGTLERKGTGTALERVAGVAGREAQRFGTLEAAKGVAEQQEPEDIALRTAVGAASGAGFGAATQAARELYAEVVGRLLTSRMKADVSAEPPVTRGSRMGRGATPPAQIPAETGEVSGPPAPVEAPPPPPRQSPPATAAGAAAVQQEVDRARQAPAEGAPTVTFKKAAIIPTREGVRAVPIEEPSPAPEARQTEQQEAGRAQIAPPEPPQAQGGAPAEPEPPPAQLEEIRRRASTERIDPSTMSDEAVLSVVHGDKYQPSEDPKTAVGLRVGGREFFGKDWSDAAMLALRKTRGWPVQHWEYDAIQGGHWPVRRTGDPAWTAEAERGYQNVYGEFVSDAERQQALGGAKYDLQRRARQAPAPAAAESPEPTAPVVPPSAPPQITGEEDVRAEPREVREPPPGAAPAEPSAGVPVPEPARGAGAALPPSGRSSAGDEGETPERIERPAAEREPGTAGDVESAGGGDRPARLGERPGPGDREGGARGVHGLDYAITDADAVGGGGLKSKATGNLEAIRLLKTIEAEGRPATADEQAALVKYVGWGGLPQAFDLAHKEYGEVAKSLKAALSDEEYAAARASTPNAHYTSAPVIRGVYDALARLGFSGGRVLEPGMGVGHFFGLMPRDMHGRSKVTGVELDPITGRIARLLYPKADVRVEGFEASHLPDRHFDAAVGNVPFGDYKLRDPRYDKYKFSIHDYFFAKALDKVRPGGLVAFVTSRYTMDASNPAVRQYLAERADLVGAIRLPNTAFKANANTEVTTDLIILQKRAPGAPQGGESWTGTQNVTMHAADGTEQHVPVNEYFQRHPEMVVGTPSLAGTMYRGNEYTVEPREGEDLGRGLAQAVQRLPQGVYREARGTEAATAEPILADASIKEGAYTVEGGKLMVREQGHLVPVDAPPSAVSRLTDLIAIRDAHRAALRAQLEDQPDTAIAASQKALNQVYDRFVKKYGAINKEVKSGLGLQHPNLKYFEDVDAPLVSSLEHYDPESGRAEKAAIFTKRVIRKPEPPAHTDRATDALLSSLDQKGRIDLEYLTALTGKSETELVEELRGSIYENPDSGQWEPAANYLSGNVRTKLALAKKAARKDSRFAENVTALEAVQPKDLDPSQIHVGLGASWIPTEDIADFIGDLLGRSTYEKIKVSHFAAEGVWAVDANAQKYNAAARTEYGTEDFNAVDLIADALNQKVPTVYDRMADGTSVMNPTKTFAAREKQERLQQLFGEWVWKDQARAERLARKYNDEFNAFRPQSYDGSHLTLPGANPAIDLRPHQRAAVWRILQTGNTLLAHVVGAGKTYTMVTAGMEAKRLGLATKPMYVVPNHMLGQFSRELLQMYPAARILAASKEDFAGPKRKAFTAKIANGDWDAVIMTHSGFGKVPVSRDFEQSFIEDRLGEYAQFVSEAKQSRNRSLVKQIEKGKKRLEARLKELSNRETKDEVLAFEELGVDMLFVDEAHLFKNLETPTKLQRISLPASQRATDLYMKSLYLQKLNPGRGLVFATGTPIANSVAEMFTMQRYLQPALLNDLGLQHFDSWVGNFGEWVTALELSPEGGGYRMNTRFARFKNVAELTQMFRQVADVQSQETLKLPIPKVVGGKPRIVAVPASDELKAYIQSLVKRAEAVRSRKVAPEVDNMLKITGDGRKAGLDMRLVSPGLRETQHGKLNRAAEEIHRIWRATSKAKSAQMVFSDLSTPKEEGFNVYDELKRKLVARGVPTNEIAYIHDAASDAAKDRLFAAVREGKVRVLMGSTEKMGAGTNVQQRLVALHHLDAPWRPSDIEQREGRILRQGNTNAEVEIHRYVTEGSFDAYMWQTLETKAKFIDQAMTAGSDVRVIEDVDSRALSYAEVKALASGNPLVMQKAGVDAEVQKLSRLQAAHRDRLFNIRKELAGLPARIEAYRNHLETVEADIQRRQDTSGDRFTIKLKGATYNKRPAAGERLKEVLAEVAKSGRPEPVRIGEFAGFDLEAAARHTTADVDVILRGDSPHSATLDMASTPAGLLQSLEHLPGRLEGDRQFYTQRLTESETDVTRLHRLEQEPFEYADKLNALLAEQKELDAKLTDKKSEQALPAEPSEEPPDMEAPGGDVEYRNIGVGPQDVRRGLQALKETAIGDAILELVAPPLRTPQAGQAARIIRARAGQSARRFEAAREALLEFRRHVPSLTTDEGLEFVDRIEAGEDQPGAHLEAAARAIREVLDERRTLVQDLGTGKLETFNENYFPHIWERSGNRDGILARILGKRPLEGSKSFLKKRSIPTTREGIDAGLTPITENPLDLVLLKIREMDRYIMAHEILQELKAEGLVSFVRAVRKAPDGYQPIDDKIATVYGPVTAEGAQTIRGRYYAPEAVAKVLNNYLSPGLRGHPLYDAYMGVGNTLNQAQLGLSFFHLGFTSLDAAISRFALAIEQAAEGRPLAATATAASVPLAPITNFLKGSKVLEEYFAPGARGAELAEIVDALVEAGGRVRMDMFYKNTAIESFLNAVRRSPGRVAARGAAGALVGGVTGGPLGAMLGAALATKILPAALELAAKPLMEYIVPRQKLGVFFDLARHELSKLPPDATTDQVRAAMAAAWDSVDNRMGQLVYDNLFWHKALKDLALASVRSVGWNLGTLREVGGGAADIAQGKLSHKAAYLIALPILVGLLGALITYLCTGDGPKELRDYYYPRTGRKNADGEDERVALPSYMKDVFAFKRHPVETMSHKANPAVGLIADMLQNEDFYGNEIHNPNDPAVEQMKQAAEYLERQFVPFGFRGALEEGRLGQRGTKALPFFGVTPAPREVVRSQAQNLMHDFLRQRGGSGATPEQAELRGQQRDIVDSYRAGATDWRQAAGALRDLGLTHRQLQLAFDRMRENTSVARFKQLTLEEAERVFALGTSDEQQVWRGALARKRAGGRLPPGMPHRPTAPRRP